MLISRVAIKKGEQVGEYTMKRTFVIWPTLSISELLKGNIRFYANHSTFGQLYGPATPIKEAGSLREERDKYVEGILLSLKKGYGEGKNLSEKAMITKDLINSYL